MKDLRRSAALAAASALVVALGLSSLPQAFASDQHRGKSAPSVTQARLSSGRISDRSLETPTYGAGTSDCRFDARVVVTPLPPSLLAKVPSAGTPRSGHSGGNSGGNSGSDGGIAGGGGGACTPQISTWTSSDFGPGSYVVQAGFADGECAGASYTLPASAFPIQLNLTEMIFATAGATQSTVTEWSVLVFEGTPDVSGPKYIFSSDGELIPHMSLPPGTTGVNVQFAIDPTAPPEDQMILADNGSHTFTIAYRIDEHNNQTQDPCLVSPPTASNAFPVTDTGGLSSAANNWLFAVNCGPFGCPAGWKKFSQLPTFCRPSGDWVIRATWTSFTCDPQGACCVPSGECQYVTQAECSALNGAYLGDNVQCGFGSCQQLNVACCFASTGGCLTLPATSCAQAGGVSGPLGSTCDGYVCFPTGACCLADGSCIGPVSPETCAAQGGTFKGNNSSCATTSCPAPTGACCFSTGFCLVLTEESCELTGSTWMGPGTNCADGNANGTADACEEPEIPADLNGDDVVDAADLGLLLGAWGTTSGDADINDDGIVDAEDLAIMLGTWS